MLSFCPVLWQEGLDSYAYLRVYLVIVFLGHENVAMLIFCMCASDKFALAK